MTDSTGVPNSPVRAKEADMAMAISLEQYLIKNRVRYDVMTHSHTELIGALVTRWKAK